MEMFLDPVLLLLLTAVVAVALSFLLLPLAKKFNWMDVPGDRKVHDSETPLCGGLAIYLAVLLSLFLWPDAGVRQDPFVYWVIIGAGAMLVLGFLDDLRNLSSTLRFLLQAVFCLLIINQTGVRLEDFGSLFFAGTAELGVMAIPITIFASLGVINAFNLSDGLDGLSGSLFLVSSMALTWFAFRNGNESCAWFLLICSMAVVGFLLLNARFPWNAKALLFLGDAGSLMLGFILAWSLIYLGSGSGRAFSPITAVWVFAVPLLDTSTIIWRRWREGRSAFSADQNHLHHAFLRAGFSVEQTWGMIILLSMALAGVGIVFELLNLPDYLSFYVFMVCAFFYYFYLKRSWASQKFLGRNFIHHDFTIEEGYG